MGIRKTIAAVIAAAMVLSMTACAKNEMSSVNSGGTAQASGNSIENIVPVILDDEIEPSATEQEKELGIWDYMPEIPVTDASAFTYKYDSELGGMVVTDYLKESPKVRIPDTLEGESVVKVDFSEVKKELTQLVMPDSVKVFNLSSTIKSSLEYANIPSSATTTVNKFKNCDNLKGVMIPDSITEIGKGAFDGCTSLTSVTIPDSVTEIGERAFQGCTGLTSVTIPDSVTEIGNYTFKFCTSLTSITIPYSVTEISLQAFASCTSLISVTVDNGVAEIGESAFGNCTSLISITIPNSVTKIGSGAFEECTSLTSVTIPDSVIKIGDSAFSSCTGLTSITIPDSVTEIGRSAFFGCTGQSSVYS